MPDIEPDLPMAFLNGRQRHLQPHHPDRLAQLGVTSRQGGAIKGRLRHHTNTSSHGDIRTLAQASRPGWDGANPRAALCDLMLRIAVGEYQPFNEALDACLHELDQDTHTWHKGTLIVDDITYEADELQEHGVVARAAVVAGGWTVLASVPDGQTLPDVVLEYLPSADVAA